MSQSLSSSTSMNNSAVHPLPKKVEVDDLSLHLWFGGDGTGETTLVFIEGGFFLMVDCCKGLAANSDFRGLMEAQLLKHASKNPDYVSLLLLSHPHLDHFGGLDAILSEHGPLLDRICIFEGITEKEVERIYRREFGERLGQEGHLYINYKSFLKAYEALDVPTRKLHVSDSTRLCNTTFVKRSDGRTASLVVDALCPSGTDVEDFLRAVRFGNFLQPSKAETRARLRQLGNTVSVVLRIEFGKSRVLLAADASEHAWRQIFAKNSPSEVRCNVLKVAHHGSANGNPAWAIDALAMSEDGMDTVAVVAPLYRYELPDQDVLVKLKQSFRRVLLTAEPLSKPLQQRMDVRIPGFMPEKRQSRTQSPFGSIEIDPEGRIREGIPFAAEV